MASSKRVECLSTSANFKHYQLQLELFSRFATFQNWLRNATSVTPETEDKVSLSIVEKELRPFVNLVRHNPQLQNDKYHFLMRFIIFYSKNKDAIQDLEKRNQEKMLAAIDNFLEKDLLLMSRLINVIREWLISFDQIVPPYADLSKEMKADFQIIMRLVMRRILAVEAENYVKVLKFEQLGTLSSTAAILLDERNSWIMKEPLTDENIKAHHLPIVENLPESSRLKFYSALVKYHFINNVPKVPIPLEVNERNRQASIKQYKQQFPGSLCP